MERELREYIDKCRGRMNLEWERYLALPERQKKTKKAMIFQVRAAVWEAVAKDLEQIAAS